MDSDQAHNLECARAAIGLRIERAKAIGDKKEAIVMASWLRELEAEAKKRSSA